MPVYFDMVSFYSNPEEYLNGKPEGEDKQAMIDEAVKQNAAMMKKASKKE